MDTLHILISAKTKRWNPNNGGLEDGFYFFPRWSDFQVNHFQNCGRSGSCGAEHISASDRQEKEFPQMAVNSKGIFRQLQTNPGPWKFLRVENHPTPLWCPRKLLKGQDQWVKWDPLIRSPLFHPLPSRTLQVHGDLKHPCPFGRSGYPLQRPPPAQLFSANGSMRP